MSKRFSNLISGFKFSSCRTAVFIVIGVTSLVGVPKISLALSCTGDPWTCVNPLTVTCSANPTTIIEGQTVLWSANSSPSAFGPFTYTWKNQSGTLTYGNGQTMDEPFDTPGQYTRLVEAIGVVYNGYPSQGSCTATVTVNPAPDCSNGDDDDEDELVDLADPGCANASDSSEVGNNLPNNQRCTTNNECANRYCNKDAGVPGVWGLCEAWPDAPSFDFTASPTAVLSGQSSTLTWSNIERATSCTASGVSGWSGTKDVGGGSQSTGPITAQRTYRLSCAGLGGGASQDVTVYIALAEEGDPCPADNQCASGLSCVLGFCGYPGGLDDQCDSNPDCEAGLLCEGGPPGVCAAPPTPACSYTYSNYSACSSGGEQTRTVVSSSPSGCTGVPVNLTRSCTPTGGSGGPSGDSGEPGRIPNPLGNVTIYEFLAKALGAFVEILIPIIVIFFIITGLMFITAQGNPEKLAVAKKAFLFTVIGAAVVLGAWVLAETIANTINAIRTP